MPAKLLKFVGVGHGFSEEFLAPTDGLPSLYKSYELYGAQEQIRWFQEHLK